MGKKFILCDNELFYTSKIKKDKIKLNYSNDDGWADSVRGEKIGELYDDGDNVHLTFNGYKCKLDYSQFEQLYLLLHLKIKNDEDMLPNFKFLEETKIDKLLNKK